MGLIATVLSFARAQRKGANVSDVKTDSGGGALSQAEHFGPAGDDSQPLPGDYVVTTTSAGTGRRVAIGYLDAVSTPTAGAGEKRIYARNSAGGVVAEVWLKSSGVVLIGNGAGLVEIGVDGTVTANGATITPDGDMITAEGISLRTHTHIGNLGAPTSVPVP